MVYYSIKQYKLVGFARSNTKHKQYDALLEDRRTKKIIIIPFGDSRYQNFADRTGLNLYPELIHGDWLRRKSYRQRHKGYLKKGYYSPGWFSWHYLW